MKNVLIVGENAYIGKSFYAFAKDICNIEFVSSRNDEWKAIDFSKYDSILHCAGIAHIRQTKDMKPLYYNVNCDLAVAVATKAKLANVGQFIFISSMAVYGRNNQEISEHTLPNPNPGDFYGASKLKAEKELQKLNDGTFNLCIVRPPMVYGRDCKGNFPKIAKLAKITPIFPDYPNKRSMIYIDNLCNFFCHIISNNEKGIFLPQNKEYVNTTELVRLISSNYKRKVIMTKLFNPIISLFINRIGLLNKLFGDLIYVTGENECSDIDFQKSIYNIFND